MTFLGLVGMLAAILSSVGYLAGKRIGNSPFWLDFLPVGLMFIFWGGASLWIFSPYCHPADVCDGGGWLASTATLAVIFIPVLCGNIVGVLASMYRFG